MSGKINETIDAHEVNIVKYNLFVALSNVEPLFICGVITVGALSNFHRLAQHSLLRRCIRKSYGYVLGYCISSQNFRLMHMHYNWQSILFDSATLHVVDAQMLQSLYSFASFSHKGLYLVICVTATFANCICILLLPYLHTICDIQLIPCAPQHTVRSISRWLIVLFWLYYSKVPCAFVRSPFNGYLYSS